MKTRYFISLLLTTFIAACSSTNTTSTNSTPSELAISKGYTLDQPIKSIKNYRLSGWNYVNSKAVIISTRGSDQYLLTLKNACHNLNHQSSIGTTATVNELYAAFDAVVVRDENNFEIKCYIDEIYKLTKTP
jgi:hypothetical protein